MYPCPGSSLAPCPSLIAVPVLPYQSSLLKVCRPSNKTVHHMRHCFCTHSGSNFCEIQTKTTSTCPPHSQLQERPAHSQDVRRKYVHLRLPSLLTAQHANQLPSQWECRSCRPRSSGPPRLRLLTPSSRLSRQLLLCISVRPGLSGNCGAAKHAHPPASLSCGCRTVADLSSAQPPSPSTPFGRSSKHRRLGQFFTKLSPASI